MTTEQKQIIKDTWDVVATIDDSVVGSLFYNHLFQIAPEFRSLFKSTVAEQSKKLMVMLHYLVRNLDQPEEINTTLYHLAQRHAKYGVKAEYYNMVGSALIRTLEQGLGSLWSEAAAEAWLTLYTFIAGMMITARNLNKEAA